MSELGFSFERPPTMDEICQARTDMAKYVIACTQGVGAAAIDTHLSIGLEESKLVTWVDVGSSRGLLAVASLDNLTDFIRKKHVTSKPFGLNALMRSFHHKNKSPTKEYGHIDQTGAAKGLLIDATPLLLAKLQTQEITVKNVGINTIDFLTEYCEALFIDRKIE